MRRSNQLALGVGTTSRIDGARRTASVALLSLALLGSVLDAPAAAQSGIEPRLLPLRMASGSETVDAIGVDLGGPRGLVLWSWQDGAFSRIAATRSSRDGDFDFGPVAVPRVVVYLAVSPVGEAPNDRRLAIIERVLPAPQIAANLDSGASTLSVIPATFEGELRIRDATTGRLVARVPVPANPTRGTEIDLTSSLGARPPHEILVEQVLEDGSRSGPAFYRFEESP